MKRTISFTDCGGEGCEECDICRYNNFLDFAHSTAPKGESVIDYNPVFDAYLKLSDEDRTRFFASPKEKAFDYLVKHLSAQSNEYSRKCAAALEKNDVSESEKNARVSQVLFELANEAVQLLDGGST